MRKKSVCLFDLEGPISIIDFAAEIGAKLSEKSGLRLQNYDMAEFFYMISNYDDYLIDVPGVKENLNIPEYQPGDTLRLMAPLYVASFSDKELISFAKDDLGLLPGCRELMKILHKEWDIYVISTSYTHFAYNVTAALSIPKDHVYCTEFNIEKAKGDLTNIESDVNVLIKEIFQKYLENQKELDSVIDDLNEFFWKETKSDYVNVMNQVKVRGGKRKELAVENISERTGIPISEMIALGDSITDIDMLERLKKEGGVAVSFNGNRFSLKRANVAITTPNNLGVLPIFEQKDNIIDFLESWEASYENFNNNPENIPKGLLSEKLRRILKKNNFIPQIHNLENISSEALNIIIQTQERMRKEVRGWSGKLG